MKKIATRNVKQQERMESKVKGCPPSPNQARAKSNVKVHGSYGTRYYDLVKWGSVYDGRPVGGPMECERIWAEGEGSSDA